MIVWRRWIVIFAGDQIQEDIEQCIWAWSMGFSTERSDACCRDNGHEGMGSCVSRQVSLVSTFFRRDRQLTGGL
jgi:hypothetical protein